MAAQLADPAIERADPPGASIEQRLGEPNWRGTDAERAVAGDIDPNGGEGVRGATRGPPDPQDHPAPKARVQCLTRRATPPASARAVRLGDDAPCRSDRVNIVPRRGDGAFAVRAVLFDLDGTLSDRSAGMLAGGHRDAPGPAGATRQTQMSDVDVVSSFGASLECFEEAVGWLRGPRP